MDRYRVNELYLQFVPSCQKMHLDSVDILPLLKHSEIWLLTSEWKIQVCGRKIKRHSYNVIQNTTDVNTIHHFTTLVLVRKIQYINN